MFLFSLFMPVRRVINQNRNWLLFAAIIFIVSGIFSYMSASAAQQPLNGSDPLMEQFQVIVSLILESHPVIAALLVFMINFVTMIQMLLLGFLAGLSPLITLFINGNLLGIVAAALSFEGQPLLLMFILGILPHGIFELFAFFICSGLGLKFGYHCLASPLPGKTRFQSFKYIWKETISVLPLVVILLFTAAVVEIMITPHLLGLITELP